MAITTPYLLYMTIVSPVFQAPVYPAQMAHLVRPALAILAKTIHVSCLIAPAHLDSSLILHNHLIAYVSHLEIL
jgi:hypothetical protein